MFLSTILEFTHTTSRFMLAQPLDDHNYHPIEDLVASITVSCERRLQYKYLRLIDRFN